MSIQDRLGNGSVSTGALRRYLRSTSNPVDGEIYRDDGGNWPGLVGRNQLDQAEQNKPHAAGFANPEADYGPADAGSIDSRAKRRGDKQSKYSRERPYWDQGPSSKRSAAVCDNEWNPAWFDKANNLR
jgi:hypothetical protein